MRRLNVPSEKDRTFGNGKIKIGFWWKATRLEKVEPRNETLSVTELDCLFSTFSLSTCYKPDLILDVGNTRRYVKETSPSIPGADSLVWETNKQTNYSILWLVSLRAMETQQRKQLTKSMRDNFTEVLEKQWYVIWWRQQTCEPVFLAKWIRQHENTKLFEGMGANITPTSIFANVVPFFPHPLTNPYSLWLSTEMSLSGWKPSLTPTWQMLCSYLFS